MTGAELLGMVARARQFVAARGLKVGDRCAVYAPNSVRWVAADLALMAEGIVVVPLDPRQVPGELAAVVRDATPRLILCADAVYAANVSTPESGSAEIALFDEIFDRPEAASSAPLAGSENEPVTIVYTSGTSGEQKGVVLTAGNLTFML